MTDKHIKPDYLFEVSWEVCNKVGGIYTVLSSKYKSMANDLGDRYIFIGPDVWKETIDNPDFIEDKSLYRSWQASTEKEGLRIRTGRWNIPGKPVAVLVDFTPFFAEKDKIFAEFWETYKLDSLSGGWDYVEPALFGYAAGYAPIPTKVFTIMGLIIQFLILVILTSYISLFLNDFVVPIMYKYKITTSKAWFKFLPILSRHLGYFVLYGLFIFVLMILVVICIVLFGLFTCCLGFLLLIIPYIGSVVLLPISYTFRAFSVEFLEQFGEDFTIFPKQEVLKEGLSE